MIDNYNDRISNLSEVEGDYTFKANFFYSIIIFIITLFAFFGYRNLTTLKETARQEAKDEARLVSKVVLTDDVKIEIERILRDGDAANNFFADLENQMKSSLKVEMEEFEKKYPINDVGEKQSQIENEINWLKDQIKSLIKKINEQ
ncbi:hypothetical protein [Ekhidna sp.]|uniref:hypothetical protein n=1 Tax=Ekhidna sp. TaxID=2608089 RepID=UPI00351193B4